MKTSSLNGPGSAKYHILLFLFSEIVDSPVLVYGTHKKDGSVKFIFIESNPFTKSLLNFTEKDYFEHEFLAFDLEKAKEINPAGYTRYAIVQAECFAPRIHFQVLTRPEAQLNRAYGLADGIRHVGLSEFINSLE